jgi:hypothetical protein
LSGVIVQMRGALRQQHRSSGVARDQRQQHCCWPWRCMNVEKTRVSGALGLPLGWRREPLAQRERRQTRDIDGVAAPIRRVERRIKRHRFGIERWPLRSDG